MLWWLNGRIVSFSVAGDLNMSGFEEKSLIGNGRLEIGAGSKYLGVFQFGLVRNLQGRFNLW